MGWVLDLGKTGLVWVHESILCILYSDVSRRLCNFLMVIVNAHLIARGHTSYKKKKKKRKERKCMFDVSNRKCGINMVHFLILKNGTHHLKNVISFQQ